MQARDPKSIALEVHRNYYASGEYADDRLEWTIKTFLSPGSASPVLEVGCGSGSLLRLLSKAGYSAVGVDASSSGIERCHEASFSAHLIDVSTDGLPFPDDSFNTVISLETFEHLMNPYYALSEVRRVLRPGGKFVCSVPNPLTGHPYVYPGLFQYTYFRQFLEQSQFSIQRVVPWQWVPRETILPVSLRKLPILRSRVLAGGIRRVLAKACTALGVFPAFCYWLWTFECTNLKSEASDAFERVSDQTRPGSWPQFATPK